MARPAAAREGGAKDQRAGYIVYVVVGTTAPHWLAYPFTTGSVEHIKIDVLWNTNFESE